MNIKKFILNNQKYFSKIYNNISEYKYILENYEFALNKPYRFYNFIKPENYYYYLNNKLLIIPICYIKSNKQNIVCQVLDLNDLSNIFTVLNFKLYSNTELKNFKKLKIKYPKSKLNNISEQLLQKYLEQNIFNKNFKNLYQTLNFKNINYQNEQIINIFKEIKINRYIKTKNTISLIIPISTCKLDDKFNGISCFKIIFFNNDWNELIKNKNLNINCHYEKIFCTNINNFKQLNLI